MKKFFTVMPLQVSGQLRRYVYQAEGNTMLQMAEMTAFPIVPAIHGYAVPGEDFRVIALMTKNSEGNREALQDELEALCRCRGLVCRRGVEIIPVPSDEKVATHADTFQKLLEFVDDDDELFACMTFGTKPLSMALMMAVQYAYRVKRNASISCIVYGQIDRPNKDPETWTGHVYDMTALVQLDEIVRVLADRGVADPKATINRILSL